MIDIQCTWQMGFVMDPAKKVPVGYLLQFQGLGMADFLQPDIEVFTPYNSAAPPTYAEAKIEGGAAGAVGAASGGKIKAVGVIEWFNFGGGVGEPIKIGAYISAQNQTQLKAKMQTTLSSTIIKKLAWWIVDFDAENKVWYEKCYPLDPTIIGAQINAEGGSKLCLKVDDIPTTIAPNIDVAVYHLSFEVVPAANKTYSILSASSNATKSVLNWGLTVGTNAATAMGA